MSADNQTPELFGQTPWQTVGPFFHYCLAWKGAADLVGQSEQGTRADLLLPGHDQLPVHTARGQPDGTVIEVHGRVLDGAGEPVPDCLLEIWHADPAGRYGSGFTTFGRCATDESGAYRFTTFRPGAVVESDGTRHAPQISLGVFARGVIKRLLTRIYFADAPENDADPALALVPDGRRETLLAHPGPEGFEFDVILQGAGETVFFRC
jgi:protocatechuate 3,4-dioxygenase alpha subunit